MITGEEFLKHLRDALKHLYEPRRLRDSPLAALFGVANRIDTPSALQCILIEAIESFEPQADAPTCSDAWRIYGPLIYRYVEQLSQPEVADQLGLSVRHLRRKEHDALEALASLLWRKFDLHAVQPEGTGDGDADQARLDHSAVREELAWLKETSQRSTIDLSKMLPGLLGLAQGLASQQGVELNIELSGNLPHVVANRVAVRQILLSLLSVAIFRAEGGQVAISAKPLCWEVEFRVQCVEYPSGPKPALADETANLNIAQQLAELSGGKLALSINARAFDAVLTFPVVEQLPVLVIDDNADTLQLLQRYASGTRYRLATTQDPEQALSMAEEFSPQIIVLDVMMPGLDGWDVLGRLRQSPITAHIPIVVCTILAQKELAQFLGASASIRKPITRQAFLDVLDRQTEQLAIGSR